MAGIFDTIVCPPHRTEVSYTPRWVMVDGVNTLVMDANHSVSECSSSDGGACFCLRHTCGRLAKDCPCFG